MNSIHHRTPSYKWLALFAGMALTLLSARAAVVVTYDYTYDGTLLPAATGSVVYTGTGSGSNTQFTGNRGTPPFTASVSSGTFTLVSSGAGGGAVGSAATYALSSANPVWSGWDADADNLDGSGNYRQG